MDDAFTHARFEAALRGTSIPIRAGELHGLLTGYLCGGGAAEGRDLVVALGLADDSMPAAGPVTELLDQARPWCREQLDSMRLGFEPLLPPDTCPLAERADAMVEWTRGFLGGFGLAGVTARNLSVDAGEVLHDLGVIAAAPIDADRESELAAEEDGSALVELIEFVRVGAMLLRTEMAAAGRTGGPS